MPHPQVVRCGRCGRRCKRRETKRRWRANVERAKAHGKLWTFEYACDRCSPARDSGNFNRALEHFSRLMSTQLDRYVPSWRLTG